MLLATLLSSLSFPTPQQRSSSVRLQPPSRRRAAPAHVPGSWSVERQTAYNEAVARRVRVRGGHGGDGTITDQKAADATVLEFDHAAAADDRRRAWHGTISNSELSQNDDKPSHACLVCSLRFDRKKQLDEVRRRCLLPPFLPTARRTPTCLLASPPHAVWPQHLAGKRHREAEEASSEHWAAYERGSWSEPSLSRAEQKEMITRAWSLDAFVR
jgi:hypothetical protein